MQVGGGESEKVCRGAGREADPLYRISARKGGSISGKKRTSNIERPTSNVESTPPFHVASQRKGLFDFRGVDCLRPLASLGPVAEMNVVDNHRNSTNLGPS